MNEQGVLRVRRDSWHRRVYAYWAREVAIHPPATVNLCHYVRAVVLYVPAFLVFVALARVVVIATWPVWKPLSKLGWKRGLGRYVGEIVLGLCVVGIVTMFVVISLDKWWAGLVVLGILAAVFVFAAVLAASVEHIKSKRNGGTSSGSLLVQFVKAKKRRVCPLIETVDS